MGAIVGSILPLATQGMELGRWLLVIALIMGVIGGAVYALIPSYLKVRLGVSEILSSLMLHKSFCQRLLHTILFVNMFLLHKIQ